MTNLIRSLAVAALLASGSTLLAQTPMQNQTTGIGAPPQMMAAMPEQCRQAAQSSPHAQMMMNMPMMQGGGMMQGMMQGANLTPAQQANMEAMRKMNPPMMMGMMIADPDLAFLCSMIAHHQGAIDMAEVAQKHGKDAEVKKHAEKIVSDQKKDLQELTELVSKRGK